MIECIFVRVSFLVTLSIFFMAHNNLQLLTPAFSTLCVGSGFVPASVVASVAPVVPGNVVVVVAVLVVASYQ